MVKLYKSRKACNSNEYNTIIDNEAFFNNSVSSRNFNSRCIEVMNTIDKAKLLDRNIGTIQTPYGVCNINDLSTGCKVVLNFIYVMENRDKYTKVEFIDATEAGCNALEELFKAYETYKNPIGIVCEHDDGLYNCSDRDYMINGNRLVKSALML